MYVIVADLDERIEDDMQNELEVDSVQGRGKFSAPPKGLSDQLHPIEMTLSLLYFAVATLV